MPFVATDGGQELNCDIVKSVDRFVDGKIVTTPGNGLLPIILTDVKTFDFNPNGTLMKEMIWRGQPNMANLHWIENPVFRVLTHRFKPSPDIRENIPLEQGVSDWERFMYQYRRQAQGDVAISWFYEPSLEDVIVTPDENYHFPLWVLDMLKALGEFEQALRVGKVNIPEQKRLTQAQYNRIMEEIEKRRGAIVTSGNLSGYSKSSKG